MDDLTGRQLGSYQIISRLGTGGMATVFQAYQPKMERYVALKVLRRHFSANPEFVSRFSQEARLIAQLEHPHILPIYDYGECDGYTYMAMRFLKGGSLSDLLKKHGRLDLSVINRIITQVGGALDYAHQRNVIHRDIKPGNILIDEFGSCLLTDFGIAKLIQATSHLTETGGILGTPFYISPEQGSGHPIDHRSDIYSLGVVLYQMIVGNVPYRADTPMAVIFKHVHDPLPLPRERVPDLPEAIEHVVLKALAKNPDDRYAAANQMVNALQAATEAVAIDMQETRKPIPELDSVQDGRGGGFVDHGMASPTPSEKQKPDREAIRHPDESKTSDAIIGKDSSRRKWTYGFLVIFLLAGFAGAVWIYYNSRILPASILTVESIPTGADVYVDDEHAGLSPVQTGKLTPGAHDVRVWKEGYESYEKRIDVYKGSPQLIRAELQPTVHGRLEAERISTGVEVGTGSPAKRDATKPMKGLPVGNRKVASNKNVHQKETSQASPGAGDDEAIDIEPKTAMVSRPREKITNSAGMEFVYITPNTFTMGSPSRELGRQKREKIHEVILTKGFYMQTTEVTLGQWRAFVRDAQYQSDAETKGGAWFRRGRNWFQKAGRYWDHPGFPQGENHPVTCVSWNDAQNYIKWLRKKENQNYRLPTESEWEYACRAESVFSFSNGEIVELKCGHDANLNAVGWYCGNSNRRTHPVGEKEPNKYGLYDLHGNVWEWCQDWFAEYPPGPVADPSGPANGKAKVRRGGSWGNDAWACRSACRAKLLPDRATRGIGFRLVREP